jgi:ABC-2 type transport system permease protein
MNGHRALWHKAWLETRGRFLMSALAMSVLCVACIWWQADMRMQGGRTVSYAAYVHRFAYNGWLRGPFVMLAMVLGLGGLLRERSHGTAPFTLSLPAGRFELTAVSAAVGLAQLVALALLPALLIPALSPWLAHESYPLSQSFEFAALWVTCGGAVFASAFLVATILGGEYNGFMVTWLLFFVYTMAANAPPLRAHPALNLNRIMSGSRMVYFDVATSRLAGLPWPLLAVVGLVGLSFLALSWQVVERRDF